MTPDIIVIGAGIAGLSAAAELSDSAKVVVIEAEGAPGYHSSGRSATYYHLGIGNRTVRALTTFSRAMFEAPPAEGQAPISTPKPALWVATEEMIPALNALHDEMRIFSSDVHHISASQARELVPVLRIGPQHIVAAVIDETGRKLDADALLQGNIRRLRRNGGQIEIDARLTSIAFEDGHWRVQAGDRAWRAPILVNAAGAWADEIAALAGVAPLGLRPLRRTIIVFDPPPGVDASGWPFVKTAVDEFYMLPEAGKLLASPVDEAQSAPVDAQPEDFDIALAAYRVEQFTTMSVARVSHRWAGLRSFVADRIPTAGFAPDAKGFFWLAGQGGYGLQTAPAMAAATASIILGSQWPSGLADLGVSPDHIAPARLRMG